MKKILMALTLFIALLSPILVVSGQAAADNADVFQNCGSGSAAGSPTVCQDENSQQANNHHNNPIVNILKAAINVLSYLIGAGAIIGIIVSAIRMMTAGGDSNAVASARTSLVYSLIGVAVAVLAQVIVAFVLDNVQ